MDITSFILGFKKGIASGKVNTQEKTIDITENGTTEVVPDDGYALSKVTVNTNVEGSGGGSLQGLGVSYLCDMPNTGTDKRMVPFILKNELWAWYEQYVDSALRIYAYKYVNGAFVKQKEWLQSEFPAGTSSNLLAPDYQHPVEYEGVAYFNSTYDSPYPIWSFDGENVTKICDAPDGYAAKGLFVSEGNMYHASSKALYRFDISTNTFVKLTATVPSFIYIYSDGNEIYFSYYTAIYKFNSQTETFDKIHATGNCNRQQSFALDGKVFNIGWKKGLSSSNAYYAELYHYDFSSDTPELVGRFPQSAPYMGTIGYNGEVFLFGQGAQYVSKLWVPQITE